MSQSKKPERAEKKHFNHEMLNSIVQTLAILAAGIWGVYTFIYQAKIAPDLAPPTLSVTCTLEKAGQKGNMIAIRSTVTRTNVGQARVRLLGITYNVIGIKEHFGTSTDINPGFNTIAPTTSTVREPRYYGKPDKREVILRVGNLFEGATNSPSAASVLNPGESVSRDMVFYADQTLFDSIRFQVRLVYENISADPIPLIFKVDGDGMIVAENDPSCSNKQEGCKALNTTDFTTELSLW